MNFAEKNRAFIQKLQNLPEEQKKIILWMVVGVLAVIMGFFWIKGTINSFSKIAESAKSIKLPSVDTSDMPKLPSLDILKTTTPSNLSPVK